MAKPSVWKVLGCRLNLLMIYILYLLKKKQCGLKNYSFIRRKKTGFLLTKVNQKVSFYVLKVTGCKSLWSSDLCRMYTRRILWIYIHIISPETKKYRMIISPKTLGTKEKLVQLNQWFSKEAFKLFFPSSDVYQPTF